MADAADHLQAFLESLSLDPSDDPHLADTPERVTELFSDLFSAVGQQAPQMSVFDAEDDSTVFLLAQPFRSMCAHHLVPFFGFIDIAFVPDEHIAGFGSFNRVVDWASRRPQLQERLVRQIADTLESELKPAGLLVRARARQMCVELTSGNPGLYVTLASRGNLRKGSGHESALAQFVAAEPAL